ncbi:MAG: choice-of-anchor tandem repeat GloVer-containing protein [Legionellales bacterium]
MKKIGVVLLIMFSLNANAQYTKLLDFAGASNGEYPAGSLISDGTFLYGVASGGGSNNFGVIFKIKPDGTGYITMHSFAGGTTDGQSPMGSLNSDGTYLYGMTESGGFNGVGTIFKILPNGTGYAKVFDFSASTTGNFPYGSLISDGTYLYGLTYNGGSASNGQIFKVKPNGTGYTSLHDFLGNDGTFPLGSLISDGTFLYGMTTGGGVNANGVVFKIMPNGTGFTKLLDFTGPNGNNPLGDLIYDGTFLYGMTDAGGASGSGNIFKIKPDGTGFMELFDFNGANGRYPYGSLISDGTFLYGMTNRGSSLDSGTVFKIKPDGTGYLDLHDFVSAGGDRPRGSLLLSGNCLYGMTYVGGANNSGTIFKHCLVAGIEEYHSEITLKIYPNPSCGIFSIETNSTEAQNIIIYDVNGKIVLSQKFKEKITIEGSYLSEGIYNIVISNNQRVACKRLAIVR